MALTVDEITNFVVGDRRVVVANVDFDSSYPAGGEPLTASDLSFNSAIDLLVAEAVEDYSFEYDRTNSKLIAYDKGRTGTVTVNPASLATVTAANETVTVAGLATTDQVAVQPPIAIDAGIHVLTADVSAADTLRIRLYNSTAGTIDVASGTWGYKVLNPKEVQASANLAAVTDVRVLAIGK
jgi:hypothetical protein